MSDIIRQLPDTVANQIAAGEVVQRPASALKELVENSVDAGATEIQIVVKDAGRTLLQVVDNGKGMSHNDARMAFERHATSKISTAEDLSTLHTMGFRGEALASICAISQVELKTCQMGETLGTRVIYSGGEKELQEPVVCSPGTNIMVRNLFFNIPARRKFMKSDATELAAIMREFERLALVNNNIRMTIDTGTRTIDLRPGTFKMRICDIWKNNLDTHLMPIEVDTSLVKISGFISRPEHARRRNALQYLIANGRNMRHPYFHKSIVSCFNGYIATDTQPCYFLKFTVDPKTIDVNISPTKSEIKFEYEMEIRQLLTAAIRASLGKYGAAPSIDFSQEALQLDPAREGDFVKAPGVCVDTSYNPFKASSAHTNSHAALTHRQNVDNWERLYAGFMNEGKADGIIDSDLVEQAAPAPAQESLDIGAHGDVPPLCIQCADKYILTPDATGLLVIDQYRAHVKILYERYMRLSGEGNDMVASQRVMFEEVLKLDASQSALIDGVWDELARLGFALEKGEEDQIKIMGVPAMLTSGNARDAVLRIIDAVSDEGQAYGKESVPTAGVLRERVALVTARASAIKGGTRLSAVDMEHLIGELFALPDPSHTPDGNPVFTHIPLNRIEALFQK